jgi:hypothetical protein
LIPLKRFLRKDEFSDNALDWANEIAEMLHTADDFKEVFTAMTEKRACFPREIGITDLSRAFCPNETLKLFRARGNLSVLKKRRE